MTKLYKFKILTRKLPMFLRIRIRVLILDSLNSYVYF